MTVHHVCTTTSHLSICLFKVLKYWTSILFPVPFTLGELRLIFFLAACTWCYVLDFGTATQGCFSYCWALLIQSKGHFCSSPHPISKLEIHEKLGRDTHGTPDLSWPKRYFTPSDIPLNDRSWGKERKAGCSVIWHLSSKVTFVMVGSCFPVDGWTPAYPWALLSEFLVLLCLCVLLLFYLLDYIDFNPQVSLL